MSKRNHIRLLGDRQLSEFVKVEFKYGSGKKQEKNEEEVVEESNYKERFTSKPRCLIFE